LSTATPKI